LNFIQLAFPIVFLGGLVMVSWYLGAYFGVRMPSLKRPKRVRVPATVEGTSRVTRYLEVILRVLILTLLYVLILPLFLRLMLLSPRGTFSLMCFVGLASTLYLCLYTQSKTGYRVGVGFIAAASLWWAVQPNWINADICAVMIVACFLAMIWQWVTLAKAVLISLLVMCLDICAVFSSSVMEGFVKDNLKDPIFPLFLIPSSLSLHSTLVGLLGGGDVMVPALLGFYGWRTSLEQNRPALRYGVIIGYLIGLAAALTTAVYFNKGQPATIYLCPAVGLGLLVGHKWPVRA